MNTYKKLLLGLSFVLVSIFASLLFSQRVFAFTAADFQGVTFSPITGGSVNGVPQVVGFTATIAGQNIQFGDAPNPPPIAKPTTGAFCANTLYGGSGVKGITWAQTGNTVNGQVDLDYTSGGGCANFATSFTLNVQSVGGGGGGGGTQNPSCESNFNSGFEWLICPVLHLMDDAAGAFNGFVENQLCVNTGPSVTAGAATCGGKNMLTDQVKQAWTAFRYIATALLVVILLVMVISQAVSIGPFDAYTLRKMLPRLVAAVILIQISWVMSKFFIDISNDLGQGIQSILYAPFGGQSNMDLSKLIGNGVKTAADVSGGPETFVLFFALAGSAVILFNLPGLLMLGLFVVMALFVAFFTLLLRQILIIMLVILVPVAFLLWILPGTEKYWKMWKDNFTKLLLMFPLIMALIAAGRIFAYISAQTTASIFNPHLSVAHLGSLPIPIVTADVSTFAGLAIIIVAFFAPYFLIPKTFSWGGTLMGLAAGAIAANRVTKGMREAGEREIKDYEKRWRGGKAKKYDPNKGMLSIERSGDKRFGVIPRFSLSGRAFRRAQSGHYLPTERSRRQTIAAGNQWAAERNDEAEALVTRVYEKARDNGYEYTDPDTGKKELKTGVEAAKYAIGDIAGNDDGSDTGIRAAQAATKMMMDTSSWIEFQKFKVSKGANKGKRVSELPIWNSTLTNDSKYYSGTLGPRPDFAPDVIEGATQTVDNYETRKKAVLDKRASRQGGLSSYTPLTPQERQTAIDKERIKTTLTRMRPEDVPKLHFGFFEDIDKLQDKGVSDILEERLQTFSESGELGQRAIASLRGQDYEAKVDRALGHASAPRKLESFVLSASGHPTTAAAPAGAAVAPAAEAVTGAAPTAGTGPPAPANLGAPVRPGGRPATSFSGSPQAEATPAESVTAASPREAQPFNADMISEAVTRGVIEANKKAKPATIIERDGGVELNIEHPTQTVRMQPGDTFAPSVTRPGAPSGVILTPGGQRDLERNPPTPPILPEEPPSPPTTPPEERT